MTDEVEMMKKFSESDSSIRKRKINSKLLDDNYLGYNDSNSECDSVPQYMQGAEGGHGEFDEDENQGDEGEDNLKESEFTRYVHEAKNEL